MSQGGAERVARFVAEHFSNKSGIQVVLITNSHISQDFYSICPKVKRISLRRNERSNQPRFIQSLSTIVRLVRIEEITHLVGFMPREIMVATLAGRLTGATVIGCERNFPPSYDISKKVSIARWVIYRFAHQHIVQTAEIGEWIRHNLGARNITIIPNSVSYPIACETPVIQPKEILVPGEKYILAVGSKAWQKGFDKLVEVFSRIATSFPHWKLIILGMKTIFPNDVWAEAAIQEIVGKNDLQDRVIFVPAVGNVGDWYDAADVFVLSSRYEGMPNVLLEAMASGRCCVCFDCPTGPRDLVLHGENGILVPDGDLDELQRALMRVMDDEELRSRLGRSATAVRKSHAPDRIMKLWEDAIIGQERHA